MLDKDGYRPNVGIVIANGLGQVLWARRIGGHDAWQFPQGGVNAGENLKDALFRELEEEVGLTSSDVRVLAQTSNWLRYRLPRKFRRHNSDPRFKGQKQHWFLLELTEAETAIRLDANVKPEFDGWKWVSYWYPIGQVVEFKRPVYQRALRELAPHLPLPPEQRANSRNHQCGDDRNRHRGRRRNGHRGQQS